MVQYTASPFQRNTCKSQFRSFGFGFTFNTSLKYGKTHLPGIFTYNYTMFELEIINNLYAFINNYYTFARALFGCKTRHYCLAK